MRRLAVLVCVLVFGLAVGRAQAQSPSPIPTEIPPPGVQFTGPLEIQPGARVTYDVIDHPSQGERGGLIITWIGDAPDLSSLKATSANVVKGTAQLVTGDSPANSSTWHFTTTSTIRLTFDIPPSTQGTTFTLFGVELFGQSTGSIGQAAPVYYAVKIGRVLPGTGGPPEQEDGGRLLIAGAVLLFLSAACVVWATRFRRGESR